jgi:uncharacterized protein involved in outer membrane biogenesis
MKKTIQQITVSSMWGGKTQQPIVTVVLKDVMVQLSINEARDLAANLTGAVEAAISDGLIIRFLTEKVGLDNFKAVVLLKEFRQIRDGIEKGENEHE